MSDGLRYTTFNEETGSTHDVLSSLIADGSQVLDVGCATGYIAERLTGRGCEVVGIEVDPAAAELAGPHCARVIVADLETADLGALLPGEQFDVILLGDVLEHLRDPGRLLAAAVGLLNETGTVVASIPNVAHASVRLSLLGGNFDYRRTGLLDSTHLRFFTQASFDDLLEASGLAATGWTRIRVPVRDSEIPVPQYIPAELARLVESDPNATTYQFVVRAVPSAGVPRRAVEALAAETRFHELAFAKERERGEAFEQELGRVQAYVARLERHVADLEQRNDALEQETTGDRGGAGAGTLHIELDEVATRLSLAESELDERNTAFADLEAAIAILEEARDAAVAHSESTQTAIDQMAQTRVWKTGMRYYRLKSRIKGG